MKKDSMKNSSDKQREKSVKLGKYLLFTLRSPKITYRLFEIFFLTAVSSGVCIICLREKKKKRWKCSSVWWRNAVFQQVILSQRRSNRYTSISQAPKNHKWITEESNCKFFCKTLTEENGVNNWQLAVYVEILYVSSHQHNHKVARTYTGQWRKSLTGYISVFALLVISFSSSCF